MVTPQDVSATQKLVTKAVLRWAVYRAETQTIAETRAAREEELRVEMMTADRTYREAFAALLGTQPPTLAGD